MSRYHRSASSSDDEYDCEYVNNIRTVWHPGTNPAIWQTTYSICKKLFDNGKCDDQKNCRQEHPDYSREKYLVSSGQVYPILCRKFDETGIICQDCRYLHYLPRKHTPSGKKDELLCLGFIYSQCTNANSCKFAHDLKLNEETRDNGWERPPNITDPISRRDIVTLHNKWLHQATNKNYSVAFPIVVKDFILSHITITPLVNLILDYSNEKIELDICVMDTISNCSLCRKSFHRDCKNGVKAACIFYADNNCITCGICTGCLNFFEEQKNDSNELKFSIRDGRPHGATIQDAMRLLGLDGCQFESIEQWCNSVD